MQHDQPRSGGFDRDRLPTWEAYADIEGLHLVGRGRWRTTRCDLHGGSDSLRINTESSGWCCMACYAKGGDVLSYHQQRHGLDFVAAAKALGAWSDDGGHHAHGNRPRSFSARDALTCMEEEINVCMVVISDVRSGVVPNEPDWTRFLQAAGRIARIAQEARR
ncbi:MAG: hypothetical protein R3E78_16105 [Burkholderiaceae bacterium]